MGHGASPAESSGSPEQIRLAGVDAVIPLDAQGKLSPARPGPGPPHSLCWLGSAAKSFEAPGVRVPAPPAAALRSGEVTGLPGHTSVPKRCGCGTRRLAPGQGQAGPGSEGQPGRELLCSFGTGGSSFPAPRSAPLAITVNSSPGDRQFPEFVFFFFISKKRAWFLL